MDEAQRVKVTFPRLCDQEAARLGQKSFGVPLPTKMSGKLTAGSRRSLSGVAAV